MSRRLKAEELHQTRSSTGITFGGVLAGRIHDALQVDSLEALESAAHDGRLASVPGMGARRVAMIRCSLAGMLGRRRLAAPTAEPPVAMLLDVDEEYRGKAAAGRLVRNRAPPLQPLGEALATGPAHRARPLGISPRSSRTPLARTSSVAPRTGSWCTSMPTTRSRGSTRS